MPASPAMAAAQACELEKQAASEAKAYKFLARQAMGSAAHDKTREQREALLSLQTTDDMDRLLDLYATDGVSLHAVAATSFNPHVTHEVCAALWDAVNLKQSEVRLTPALNAYYGFSNNPGIPASFYEHLWDEAKTRKHWTWEFGSLSQSIHADKERLRYCIEYEAGYVDNLSRNVMYALMHGLAGSVVLDDELVSLVEEKFFHGELATRLSFDATFSALCRNPLTPVEWLFRLRSRTTPDSEPPMAWKARKRTVRVWLSETHPEMADLPLDWAWKLLYQSYAPQPF